MKTSINYREKAASTYLATKRKLDTVQEYRKFLRMLVWLFATITIGALVMLFNL